MVVAVTNLKGGVGKTIIAQNLAVCLAHMGYSVCLVDTDTNQNSLSWSGVRDTELPNILTVGSTEPKAVSKQVSLLSDSHDFVIIDGTPSLSEMTTRIILASEMLLIPILPAANDLRAMSQFLERYEQAKEFKDEIPAYFILNQFQGYSIQNSVKEALTEFEIPLMESTFRNRVAYMEASADGKGVFEWSDDKAATEAANLTKEVIELIS